MTKSKYLGRKISAKIRNYPLEVYEVVEPVTGGRGMSPDPRMEMLQGWQGSSFALKPVNPKHPDPRIIHDGVYTDEYFSERITSGEWENVK